MDLAIRNIIAFGKENSWEFKLIDFDWAIKINDAVSSQPFYQTIRMIKNWINLPEDDQMDSFFLKNIFKDASNEEQREVINIKIKQAPE